VTIAEDVLRQDRAVGALLGLACGDAVGTTVEFEARGSFDPVTDMVGGGPFSLAPGQWTDDTSMALCLATSLVCRDGFDPVDQMNRYVNWWQWGYLSSTVECFDIGITTAKALQRYQATGDPYAGDTDPRSAGNGSLMRLAPVVLHFLSDRAALRQNARLSSMTTHAAVEAVDACELFADLLARAIDGDAKASLWATSRDAHLSATVRQAADPSLRDKTVDQIRSSGYCIDSLEAAMWCFARSTSFESTILTAANLGGDADTVAAIAGQLAGAHYGASAIPSRWLEQLAMRAEIERLGVALLKTIPG
jgi:ADP-ribosyl-[dinitrogen reductase] hydrolase